MPAISDWQVLAAHALLTGTPQRRRQPSALPQLHRQGFTGGLLCEPTLRVLAAAGAAALCASAAVPEGRALHQLPHPGMLQLDLPRRGRYTLLQDSVPPWGVYCAGHTQESPQGCLPRIQAGLA